MLPERSPGMRVEKIGRAQVGAIGQGTGGVGGYFTADLTKDAISVRLLREAVEKGMTFIDTAEIYGGGHAEELVGQAIKGIRQSVFVATKFSPEHSSYDQVIKAAENSLRRLGTDYIDLYQTHWRSYSVPFEETLKALERLVSDGKVVSVGLSNASMKEAREALSFLGARTLVSLQHEYNLLERTVEELLLPFCEENELTFIAYSPLVSGKVVGRDARFEELTCIAQKYEVSPVQIVLNWIAGVPGRLALVRASSDEHLRENSKSLDFSLAPEDRLYLSNLYRPDIREISTDLIRIAKPVDGRNVYYSLEEALENRFKLCPSPTEFAKVLAEGEIIKPVKVREVAGTTGGGYELVEGRLKYWAWVIAYGGKRPIRAVLEG